MQELLHDSRYLILVLDIILGLPLFWIFLKRGLRSGRPEAGAEVSTGKRARSTGPRRGSGRQSQRRRLQDLKQAEPDTQDQLDTHAAQEDPAAIQASLFDGSTTPAPSPADNPEAEPSDRAIAPTVQKPRPDESDSDTAIARRLIDRADDDEAAGFFDDPAASSLPEHPQGGMSEAESLRKASRMEELNLHIGISSEQPVQAETPTADDEQVASLLDDAQTKRLRELGLLGDGDEQVDPELDDILGRLDAALDESAVDENSVTSDIDGSAGSDATIDLNLENADTDTELPPPSTAPDEIPLDQVQEVSPGGEQAESADDDPGPAAAADFPSWARADTFDEDLDEGDDLTEPKQESLFD